MTGTRAEFGLMQSTLAAIQAEAGLTLQIVATGMHFDRSRGYTLSEILGAGWKVDRTVPWSAGAASATQTATRTARAMMRLASVFEELSSDIILVAGDRVEAFAAASAAHISGRLVAHVHGGDRALGQIDDSLRHAITKLAHVHFPATKWSAQRIARLGEDQWRIVRAGSPGLDDLNTAQSWKALQSQFPTVRRRRYGLIVLHPQTPVAAAEASLASATLSAALNAAVEKVVVIYPNNDPGAAGIASVWNSAAKVSMPDERCIFRLSLPRRDYLGLLKESAFLLGNSSSGIIEAASFGVPVINVGTRQAGREHGKNVHTVPATATAMTGALRRLSTSAKMLRFDNANPYGGTGAGGRIARHLSQIDLPRHLCKLIRY